MAVALVVQLLLNLLGAGIGAAVIDPGTAGDNPSATTLSVSTAVWFVVSGLIASFAGGYVASRLSGRPVRSTGALHGLTSWAVTTLVIVYLLTTSVGALVGGVFSGLGGIVSSAGSTVATAATTAAPALATATDPMAGIERNIRDASGGNDPAALRDAAVASVRAAITGDQAKAEEARTRAADAIAKAQNIPADQAKQQVAQYYRSTLCTRSLTGKFDFSFGRGRELWVKLFTGFTYGSSGFGSIATDVSKENSNLRPRNV